MIDTGEFGLMYLQKMFFLLDHPDYFLCSLQVHLMIEEWLCIHDSLTAFYSMFFFNPSDPRS